MKIKRIIEYVSFFVFLYFLLLVIGSNYNLNNVLLGVLVELLTIPFLILLLVLFVVSVKSFTRDNFKFQSDYFVSFTVTLATILMLVIVTLVG